MIKIIKDFYNTLEKKDGKIIVNNNKSYIESRIYISAAKNNNFKDDIDIIIQKPKYKDGYYDLEDMDKLVRFEEINLIQYIEENLSINLLGISNEDIRLSRIGKKLNIFTMNYNKHYNFYQNIIMFNFKTRNIMFCKDANSLVNFVLDNIELIDQFKLEKNITLEYLKNEVKGLSQSRGFLWFIDILDYKTNTEKYIETIIFSEIFKGYKEFEKEIIGKLNGYEIVSFNLEQEILDKLLIQNIDYLEKLNYRLMEKEKQLYLFTSLNDETFNTFIESFTGILEFEFNTVFEYIIRKFPDFSIKDIEEMEGYAYLIENKFQKLISMNANAKDKIVSLKSLITKFKILSNMRENINCFDKISHWINFYKNQYMFVKNDLYKQNNIYYLIYKTTSNQLKKSLIEKVDTIIDYINNKYEEFIYKNFAYIHNEKKFSISNALSQISYYSNNIVFFVIDAMRWDIWEIVKDIFEEYGYIQNNINDALISMVPTVTSISRLSLFAGNKYRTIIEEKAENAYSFDYRNEEKHFKRFFKNKVVNFGIGGKKTFNCIMEEDADIYAFIYSEADDVIHGLSDLNKEVIYYMLKEQIENIINKVENNLKGDAKVVVTTDHGSIELKKSKGIYIEKFLKDYLESHSINYDIHGKYIRIYSDVDVSNRVYNEIYDYFKQQGFYHIISRDRMNDFYLPKEENGEYNLLYLMCKYGYHIGTTKGSNTHGGISMNETIIPFGVFGKEIKDVKDLELSIEGDLTYNFSSKAIVKIYNQNNFDITNALLSVTPFVYDYTIDLIEKKSYKQVELNIIPDRQGIVSSRIILKYNKYGNEFELFKHSEIKVNEDLKTRISKGIKNSRRLDF